MKRPCLNLLLRVVLSVVGVVAFAFGARAADSAAIKKIFADPPREYASAPLWVWNDMLTEEQIAGTMQDLAGQKVKQVFVHPRPGLMTPYLSADWFRLWKRALKEAERLDMNVWIYDENSYPSGFAGGLVPDAMPESRGRGLHFAEVKQPGKIGDDVLGVYRLGDGTKENENVTPQARKGEKLPEGRYLVASIRRAPNSPWHGGKCYVDLLYPGVTQKFLEVTLEPYRREIGEQFGKRVPGSFTDEPELRPAGGLPWTDDLPTQFQKRWGYSLLDNLPSLTRPVGQWKQVRHDYYQTLLDLFVDRWAKPYYEYCQKHNLEFTGHYWEHEWPNCISVPDNMAMYAWHQRPAIDCLMNRYEEHTHGQFGNARAVKELSSVANQLGRRRTLCEAYGAGGWDLRFEDMKRIGDWLLVLGVNTLDEHLSYITLRGARKWDHPQSFSYHEPWWEAYHVMAQYFTRLSAAMSQGEQVNSVLLIQPTTTAWLYQADATQAKQLKQLGDQFQSLLNLFERTQVEYDIGCEDIMTRHAAVKTAVKPAFLTVGGRAYDRVVLPPGTENLNEKTMKLLEDYAAAGGRVFCCGTPPSLVDGRPSNRGQTLAKLPGWQQVEPDALPEKLAAINSDGFAIRRSPNDKGILFHQRRRIDDGELLLLVNTSIEAPSAGEVFTLLRNVERWTLETGETAAYPCVREPMGVNFTYQLPPCGSLLLFLSKEAPAAKDTPRPKNGQPLPILVESPRPVPIPATGETAIRRIEPNVLAIDFLDVTAGGETKKGLYVHKAGQFAFQKNGMDRNPWDSAVQFGDELIARKFPPESGVEATYRFTIEGDVPKPLWIVIERPDLYTITCNGKPVTTKKDQWWLDRAFGRIDITAAAKVGENEVHLKASPFTIYHELATAYVLGDFALKPAAAGFVIARPTPLKLGSWNAQGLPLYATGVAYTETFDVPKPAGKYSVRLPSWYGSVAKVSVNGKPAGYIAYAPWQCDVTKLIQPGKNTVEVTVIGTLKNTLGPHHASTALGAAWPANFHQSPAAGPPAGDKYHTVGYGLFEPLVLENVKLLKGAGR
jgi:hypothetical protein